MSASDTQPYGQLPSKRKLAIASACALAGAAIILVTAILPAEYGVDPLGTGELLGLTKMSAPIEEVVAPSVESVAAYVPVQEGPVANYPAAFNVNTVELVLDPYEYVEFKYHLSQGAAMVYSWNASMPLIQDFHGGPDADPKAEQSFDKNNKRNANGSYVAPFTGIHGWYWENPGSDRITIKLTTAGYYSSAVQIKSDRTRISHDVQPAAATATP